MIRPSRRGAACASLLLVGLALGSAALADEGLWPLDRLEEVDQRLLDTRGMNVDPPDIRELAGAVVKLRARGSRAGATGSFVSEQGLILTNHHVAYRCIANNATSEDDLLANGFLATSRAEERPCPRLEALVPVSIRDVSDALASAGDEDEAEAELLAGCEAREDRACEVAHEAPSGRTVLVEYALVRDVRLVHAPEESFASFGGAIDNFEWPRHSADYTLLRAYAGAEGQARPHDPSNLPYRPLQVLRPARIGVTRGDVVFSLGYPYRTTRYLPLAELETLANVLLPERVALDEALTMLAAEHARVSSDASIALASLLARYENRLKLHRALAAGLERTGLVERRRRQQKEILAAESAGPPLGTNVRDALARIEGLSPSEGEARRNELLDRTELFRSLAWGLDIAERAVELSLPEAERRPRFRGQALAELESGIRAEEARVVAAFEARALELFVTRALALPEGARLRAVESRVKRPLKNPRETAAGLASSLVGSTVLLSSSGRAALLTLDAEGLASTDDGLLAFARDLDLERRALRDAEREENASREEALEVWHEALVELSNDLAPDANGTLRFSHGLVRGYAPPGRGSRFGYATTASSLAAANTDEAPHRLPERVFAQVSGRKLPIFEDHVLGDVPVNFVATLDGIGGSSGSPVLDARGQLVGLVFDLNHEAAANGLTFDARYGRAIAVDIRFVLDCMLRVYGAVELVREIGLGGSEPFVASP